MFLGINMFWAMEGTSVITGPNGPVCKNMWTQA